MTKKATISIVIAFLVLASIAGVGLVYREKRDEIRKIEQSVIVTEKPTAQEDEGSSETGGTQQPYRSALERRIRSRIEKTIFSQPSAGYAQMPPGVRVLDVQVDGDKITVNLSQELLSSGTGSVMEDALHRILTPLSDVVPKLKHSEYKILIEGIPLNEYLDRTRIE